MIHDISPPITQRLGVWPGDTPVSRRVLCDMRRGDNITLSTLTATVHLGSHADGPCHYGTDAPGVGEMQLDRYLGPCHVINAKIRRGERVAPAHLELPVRGIVHPRVLIRTGTFPDPENWNADFGALSTDLVAMLASQGVRTVGIDTPSVDLQDSKDLPAHKAILAADIAILEGLVLSVVVPGEYELIALPLRLMGWDASPVRAVLRSMATSLV